MPGNSWTPAFAGVTERTTHHFKDFGLLASAQSKLRMTLRAVEEVTGISNAYLSQLEHGRIKTPAPQNLYKLAELYRVPYELLMELAGYPVPKVQSAEPHFALGSFAARIGTVTEEEEEALVEYLQLSDLGSGGGNAVVLFSKPLVSPVPTAVVFQECHGKCQIY